MHKFKDNFLFSINNIIKYKKIKIKSINIILSKNNYKIKPEYLNKKIENFKKIIKNYKD